MKLLEQLKSMKTKFTEQIQKVMHRHERVILDSHIGIRIVGYTINGIGTWLSVKGYIDWQTTATSLAIFNAIGMTYTWGTTAYLLGASNETDIRRLINFSRRSAERIWNNPQQGIDETKEAIKQEAQTRPGLIGAGLRSALHTYNNMRRLPYVDTTLTMTRIIVENNIDGLRKCTEAISPHIPADYYVEIPQGEYRNPAEFKYAITSGIGQNKNHRARNTRLHLY